MATRTGFASKPTAGGTSGAEPSGSLRRWKGTKGTASRPRKSTSLIVLRSGERFETGATDYLDTFSAVEAAYRSAESGLRVQPEQICHESEEMSITVACIHTGYSVDRPVPWNRCKKGPQIRILHSSDEAVFERIRNRGRLDPEDVDRLHHTCRLPRDAGARAVLVTCSTLSPCVRRIG